MHDTKNVFVYPQTWLWAWLEFPLFFFRNLIHWTVERIAGRELWIQVVSTDCRLWRLAPFTRTFWTGWGVGEGGSSTSYPSHSAFVVLEGDVTRKHNLTPQFHSFSSIRLDWNFAAHFPGAVKWAVSHASEPAPAHLLQYITELFIWISVRGTLYTNTSSSSAGTQGDW